MKKIIIMFALGLLTQPTIRAQGPVYLSNLGQTSTGSVAVGSDSWLAEDFTTGTNVSGYSLNSIQLEMADASGNPTNFAAMLYSAVSGGATLPGSNLGTLDGSLNPTTAGIYTFTPASNLTLSAETPYFIVLTAGTAVANGAYGWGYANTSTYNPSGRCWGELLSFPVTAQRLGRGLALIHYTIFLNLLSMPPPFLNRAI